MIPKKIHYCWFGKKPKPKSVLRCIYSWKKFCPDYEIIEWNEENFDIKECPIYVMQAYAEKKWAFVTDYVRLKVVYDYGGIYMDTDVELKKRLNSLLKYKAYFGFEDGTYVATGLGFGAEKGTKILSEMMQDYRGISFCLEDGRIDMTPCPQRNTNVLLKHGLVQDDSKQILHDNILILPSIYLCPLSYSTMHMRKSFKTISIHWFSASWKDEEEEKKARKCRRKRYREEKIDYLIHTPNRIGYALLGDELYGRIKAFFIHTIRRR